MGGGQSVRATQFSRPENKEEPDLEDSEDQHISISNKMVERLVEDVTLAKSAEAAASAVSVTMANINKASKQDHKETKFIEKLKSLDETHTERAGLTVDEMRALHKRVELRTANIPELQDVCEGAAAKLIACYNTETPPRGVPGCWKSVHEFSKCVQDASVERLRTRSVREAREQARLTQCVAQARREHTLKDIAPKLKAEYKSEKVI